MGELDTGEGGNTGDSKQMRLPRKNIQQEYLGNMLLQKRDFDSTFRNITRLDDIRPYLQARQLVNSILDDDIRYALIDKLDERINKIESTADKVELKSLNKIKICQDVVGEVNSYMDEFFALHKGQVIGDV